jgi:uncharacterized membrane protein HdeD (DUF308 family)
MSSMNDADRESRDDGDNLLRVLSQSAWEFLLILGLVSVAIGVITLVWPGRTLQVIGILFGIYLLVSGVVEIVTAFGDHVSGGMRVLNFIVGALSIVLGLFCFRGALESVLLLSLWIGIGFLMRGLAMTIATASAPTGTPGKGWGIFLGLVVTVGGIVVISWPIGSIVTLAVFIGIWLIAVGLVEIFHAFRIRSQMRQSGQHTGRHATA